MDGATVKELARACGFELCGIAAAVPAPEYGYFQSWVAGGLAGEMRYLTDQRAALRRDARSLLPEARSVICVGKLYDTPWPYSTEFHDAERAWISRYAWGDDYHELLRRGLEDLARRMRARADFTWRVAVDTAPLLERAYARRAGLGWIAKNTCLINEEWGSWLFLGELLVSLELEPDAPPPDRCGSCTRCIDACPTQALVPITEPGGPAWALDARRCISYYTIECRGDAPESLRAGFGNLVFGCDVCQDVCPWNRSRRATEEPGFAPREFAPLLERLGALTETEFAAMFRQSPVRRAKYAGFLRNVALAMGNSRSPRFLPVLERLARHADPAVSATAAWAQRQIQS